MPGGPQRVGHAHALDGVEAGVGEAEHVATVAQPRRAFDHDGREAALAQAQGQRQPGDARARDQHPHRTVLRSSRVGFRRGGSPGGSAAGTPRGLVLRLGMVVWGVRRALVGVSGGGLGPGIGGAFDGTAARLGVQAKKGIRSGSFSR